MSAYKEYLDSVLDREGIPGAQVCIIDDTGVVYSGCYGYRDSEKTLPVNEETIFGIASLSKTITSICLAILEHEGKLSFDDPVIKYFPRFKLPGTPRDAVLLKHLASHTSGMPSNPLMYWSMKWNTEDDPWEKEMADALRKVTTSHVETVDDIIDYINKGEYTTLGQPGQYLNYLNEGYAILSAIIDMTAGESYESFAQKRIFDPLGMTHTTFDLEKVMANPNHTHLFYPWESEMKCSDIWDNCPPYRGCGWIKSTAHDMAKFYYMLSAGGVYEGEQIVPFECTERIVGREFPETANPVYCYGAIKHLFKNGECVIDHSGSLKGISSRGGYIKNGNFGAIILTNVSYVNLIPYLDGVFNIAMGFDPDERHYVLTPTGKPVADPDMYVGHYKSNELGYELWVERDDEGNLYWKQEGMTFDLVHCGATDFLVVPQGADVSEGTKRMFNCENGKMKSVLIGSRTFQRVD